MFQFDSSEGVKSYHFTSQFDRLYGADRKRRFSNTGSGVVVTYSPSYDSDGILQLEASGTHNLYDEIQSHRESTDLALIISRYFNGDPGVLSRVQGVYADISEMPRNIHEAMSLMENARSDFFKLPPDIKEQFGNDPNQFLASLGSAEWLTKMQVPAKDLDPSDAFVQEKVGE